MASKRIISEHLIDADKHACMKKTIYTNTTDNIIENESWIRVKNDGVYVKDNNGTEFKIANANDKADKFTEGTETYNLDAIKNIKISTTEEGVSVFTDYKGDTYTISEYSEVKETHAPLTISKYDNSGSLTIFSSSIPNADHLIVKKIGDKIIDKKINQFIVGDQRGSFNKGDVISANCSFSNFSNSSSVERIAGLIAYSNGGGEKLIRFTLSSGYLNFTMLDDIPERGSGVSMYVLSQTWTTGQSG